MVLPNLISRSSISISRNLRSHKLGFDLSGDTFQLYPSDTDRDNGTNPIPLIYTNVVANFQYCYLGLTYSGTGPEYNEGDLLYHFSCWPLVTVSSLADADGDSLTNAAEDLNGNKMLIDENTDSDGFFNFMDADDDNDGIPTADETGDLDGNTIPDYLESPLGVGHALQPSISIYPNPSNGIVHIDLGNASGETSVGVSMISVEKQLKHF